MQTVLDSPLTRYTIWSYRHIYIILPLLILKSIFNPSTTIGYVLKEKSNAKLILLNVIGEEVAVLVNEEQNKGFHKVDFNAANLISGVYFYRLQAGSFVQTRKMILLK